MPNRYVVRYGVMRSLGVLSVQGREHAYLRGDRVVARTKRGLEAGEVLCEATPEALEGNRQLEQGEIIRLMSSSDASELSHLEGSTAAEFEKCQEYVDKLQLEMELVDIERVFGGERIVIYYLSENRVDFRELVRQLAREFQTRIEMRQIGVRDEAKLLADYGDCGKPVCCNNHLSSMPPVSMKMAKIQKATLDPNKISGRCGRLKCCLRYEYDTYLEMQKELPPVGSEIVTKDGKATVLAQEILASQLMVQNEDNRRVLIEAAEVLTVTRVGSGRVDKKRGGKSKSRSNSSSATSSEKSESKSNEGPTAGASSTSNAPKPPEPPSGSQEKPASDAPIDAPKKGAKPGPDAKDSGPDGESNVD